MTVDKQTRLGPADREEYVRPGASRSRRYTSDPSVRGIAPDEEDDLVLGTAVATGADFLLTGDRGLLAIGHYGQTRIVTADAFLAELEGP